MPAIAFGFGSYRVLELLEALRAWLSPTLFEAIPKKVKTPSLGGIHDPCLVGVQRQSDLGRPLLHHLQRSSGFSFTVAKQHEVIRIPHHLNTAASHKLVQRVEIDV